jgi:hypothetical protein
MDVGEPAEEEVEEEVMVKSPKKSKKPKPSVDPLDGFASGLDIDAALSASLSPVELIADWLVHLQKERRKEKCKLDRLELHLTGQSGDAIVKEWPISEVRGHTADSVAQDIYDTACEDAAVETRMSRYVVRAFGPDEDSHCRRHFFRVAPADKEGLEFETEPTSQDVTGALRYTNAIVKRLVGVIEKQHDLAVRQADCMAHMLQSAMVSLKESLTRDTARPTKKRAPKR